MDSDAAVWTWIGHYLWAPLLALFGGIAVILWNVVNKEVDKKSNSIEVFRELARLDGLVKSALERKIFDDYVGRADDQRREDRLAVITQFAEMKVNQSTILDKIDKIVAILLQTNQGRRSGDDRT